MGTPVIYNQFKLKQINGNAIDLTIQPPESEPSLVD